MKNSIALHVERLGISYEKLAAELFVSPQLIHFWECGIEDPSLSQALYLRKILKTSLDELFLNDIQVINFSDIKEEYKIKVYEVYYSFIDKNINLKKINENSYKSKIRFLRDRTNIKQEKLASCFGVSRSLIRNWESNIGTPTLRNLIGMSKAFGVTLEYFVNIGIGFDEIGLTPYGIEEIGFVNLNENQKRIITDLIECYRN